MLNVLQYREYFLVNEGYELYSYKLCSKVSLTWVLQRKNHFSICSVAHIDLYGKCKNSAGTGRLVGKIEGREKIWNILIQNCLYWPPLARDAGTLSKLLHIKGTTQNAQDDSYIKPLIFKMYVNYIYNLFLYLTENTLR